VSWTYRASALALAVALSASAAAAQDGGAAPPPTPSTAPTGDAGSQVYTPADFARFAPKTAYDMLVQVPGFTLRRADQERGLGQASENVLIDGERVANKSGGAIDELQRVSAANVARIEIVDASTLGIAGLAGQVANVILLERTTASGQFEWEPNFRAHFAEPNLFQGLISYSSAAGPIDYTLSLRNDNGRGGFGGPIAVTDPLGNLAERRREVFHSESELPTIQARFGIDGPGSSAGNLTLAYTPYWNPVFSRELRSPVGGVERTRTTTTELDGYYVDFSGDYSFMLGTGTLKLIGLRHFDHEPVDTVQVTAFADGRPDEGIRFVRDSRIGETVARGEYAWKGGANDWQVSFERAYNALDQRGSLFVLDASGAFAPVDFPEGSGEVAETRYEGIATWSRALGAKVSLQIDGGAEYSALARLDGDVPPREFVRPKGNLTLGWRPDAEWDLSLKLSRRVGQISFYDFLAQPNLREERANSGNPDLVPPQSWEAEIGARRSLGAWGKTSLRLYAHLIEDIVDIIPIGDDGEAVGNLPKADRFGAEWTSTFQFDPAGFHGARLDLTAGFEDTGVRDPLSGDRRAISGTRNRWIEASLRHDIPASDWAWGIDAEHTHFARNFYLSEINRSWEGPLWLAAYVENKDVLGLTVRAGINNLLDARHRFERTVYDGRRLRDPVLYAQSNDQLIGPIFYFLVKGTF
jgi:hypothetical protein